MKYPINKFSARVSVVKPQVNCYSYTTACDFLIIPALVNLFHEICATQAMYLIESLVEVQCKKTTALLKCNAVVLTV